MRVVPGLGFLVCLLPLALAQCGGSDEARSGAAGSAGVTGGDGAGGKGSILGGGTAGKGRQEGPGGTAGAAVEPENACLTPSAADYEPVWMPPRASPGACSSEQISQAYALCAWGSPAYNVASCRAFRLDEANSGCLGCLFSAIGDESSAALVILPGDHWIANTGGCIALLDGDETATSCGAKTQASDICQYDICVSACSDSMPTADWNACQEAARVECGTYIKNAACKTLPQNARCLYSNFKEYFEGIGDVFCGSGPGDTGEGGGGAGGAAASGSEGGASDG